MTPEELIHIINRCAKQDRAHQKALYDAWYNHNLRIAFRYVNTYEQAMEVTHQGFVNIFRHIHRFETRDRETISDLLSGWMKRMIITAAVEFRKPDINDQVPSPRKPATDDLVEMVKQLPPACHLVYNLHIIDGYSHSEIASLLGISISFSQTYLATARALLHNALTTLATHP